MTAINRHPQRRSFVQVYVDGVAAFELSRAFALKNAKVGDAAGPAEVESLIAADRRRQALGAALAMLARRARSERDVRRRLAQRKFDAATIDETIEKLHAAKLLDDAEYARTWAESRDRSSPRSSRLLVQELRSAGVGIEVARAAVEPVSDEDAALRAARRRLPSMRALDYETFSARLGGYLRRRGFGWAVCQRTVVECWNELHPAAEGATAPGGA